MLTSQTFEHQITVRAAVPDFTEINRVLAAAVVSRQFCALLLNDPARAIAQGYAGEQFFLSPDEYHLILSVRGATLPEFAKQLSEYAPRPAPAQPVFHPKYNDAHFMAS